MAAKVNPEKAAVDVTDVISPKFVVPSNKANALIFDELPTVSEHAVKVVPNASASALPPPSWITNWPTSNEFALVKLEAAWKGNV